VASLDSIRVAGATLTADVAAAVVGTPTLTSSVDEVTKLSLTLSDPGWKVTRSGLFAKQATVDTGDVPLEVSVVEPGPVGGVEGLTVVCRARGAQLLKRTRGALVRRDISPTEWLQIDATAAGLALVAERTARRTQISRVAEQGQEPDTAWETDQRLADELGFWLFEDGRRLFFARPSWLLARPDATVWRVAWAPQGAPSGVAVPMTVPELRSSDDADALATATLELPHRQGEQLRPGHVIDLSGVPAPFARRYLVTSVTVPHDGHSPIEVTGTVPIDPEPQEPVA
jgi:hypothetical protein